MLKNFFRLSVLLNVAAMLAYLAAVAYLGAFSRYMADDYCEAASMQSSTPLRAVMDRYEAGEWRAANRYSNLLLAGVLESLLGLRSVAIILPLMVILWSVGLIYLVRQVRKLAGIEWHFLMDMFFGALLAYLTILEAPNRFQVIYWRASMESHFAPLVFLNFLVIALLSRLHAKREAAAPVWFVLVIFFASFIVGGFSEPPVAVMVVGSALALAYIWFFVKDKLRHPALLLTGSVFVGAVFALGVMAFSPAAATLGADVPTFMDLMRRTFEYTYFFLIDTVKTLPLPILFSILCPALFVFLAVRQKGDINLHGDLKIAIASPFILALLVAAGFSTSAYGQGYPVERARFFAHFLLTITLVLEGTLLGIWLAQVKSKLFNTPAFEYASILILLVVAVYPFRAVLQIMKDVPEYSIRAQAWDRRDAHIIELREYGQADLTVPQFDGIYDVKELDSLPTYWVNRCAAAYYEVNSIRAIPIHGADALEEYYNYFGSYDQ